MNAPVRSTTDNATAEIAKMPRATTGRDWLWLPVFVVLVGVAAAVGSSYGPGEWYRSLAKPALNPPNWVFPVAWTPLYLLIAIAGWWIWRRARRSPVMALWFVQLALNAAWSWLFFGQHRIGAALVDIMALEAMIIALIALAWKQPLRPAALMLLPYAAWVGFATYLNAEFWRLN
jgi:benzodiazapine receptor